MSDGSARPLWPWIVALLIGVPMLYVASFGPACRLEDRGTCVMTSRKQPGVAFRATVAVRVGLVLYPLSFEPAFASGTA